MTDAEPFLSSEALCKLALAALRSLKAVSEVTIERSSRGQPRAASGPPRAGHNTLTGGSTFGVSVR